MTASAMSKRRRRSVAEPLKRYPARSAGVRLRDVPNIDAGDDYEPGPDQAIDDDVMDALDPNLRHRMVSETAYRRHGECGYEDGYDLDDWLQAEADLDHLLHNPRR